MKQKAKNTLGALLLVLFVGYYGNINFFTHAHNYDWGKVVHSHLHLPSIPHSHTSDSLVFIAHLSFMKFLIIGIELFIAAFTILTCSYFVFYKSVLTEEKCLHIRLRAPPVPRPY